MEQGLVVEGVDARGAAVCKVEADDGGEHEKAAQLREEEEFDGGPEAVLMAPERDEKIHGHEHELPGKIEEEEVEAEEDAEHARDGPGEAQVKKARPLRDLAPGGGRRHAAEEGGQTDEDEARPVDGQMEADARKEDPRGLEGSEPWAGSLPADAGSRAIRPAVSRKSTARLASEIHRGSFALTTSESHAMTPPQTGMKSMAASITRNTTMAIKTAPPRAIPITYQRTFPDWVATSILDASPHVQREAAKGRDR